MSTLSSLLNQDDGKMKASLFVLGGCILLFIFSWVLMLGIGGGIAFAAGVVLVLISLGFGIITAVAVGCMYVDWIEHG